MILSVTVLATLGTYYWHPKRPALYLQREAPSAIGLTLETVLADSTNLVWIDVRSDQAYAQGHIPEAISLNAGNLNKQMVTHQHLFSQNNHFVIYGDPASSAAVAPVQSMLQGMGFPKVDILQDGWQAWQKR